MSSRFILGVDLGTSNCAVAFVDTRARRKRDALAVQTWPVPQLIHPGEVGDGDELPSAIYLPAGEELVAGSAALPWDRGRGFLVGAAARELGARRPDRLVISAKSWLCHDGVDRRAAILPWVRDPDGAAGEQISPVEAATRLLTHLREAWDHGHKRHKGACFGEQQLVLTVPASFDEAARALTVEAARAAGLQPTLLEEPQAAFYAWLSGHRLDWAERLPIGTRVLVCDVGGGTTDFSIFRSVEEQGELGLRREAVGRHLLLGGDNLDLALARSLEQGWNTELDGVRLAALVAQCRAAKERLLAGQASEAEVRIAGRGSRLIGATLEAKLAREQVESLLYQGFLPELPLSASVDRQARGLLEWGLPFEADAAITRHLADFLRAAGRQVGLPEGEVLRPDRILFQGGFFAPRVVRERLAAVVGGWFGGPPLETLASADLARSVAIGAAYYGLARRGAGLRIAGGTPRAYFIGLDTRADEPPRGVCLAPRGLEEGAQLRLSEPAFQVKLGRPVRFSLHAATEGDEQPGALVELDQPRFEPLAPVSAQLEMKKYKGARVGVELGARLTEVGTLELELIASRGGKRFELEFDVRPAEPESAAAAPAAGPQLEPATVEAALAELACLERPEPQPVQRLTRSLEAACQLKRREWPLELLRPLADALLARPKTRRTSATHELRWMHLVGFALRPGLGCEGDEGRIKKLWPLFQQGLHHARELEQRAAWCVLWRRVAAGLSAGQQRELGKPLLKALTSPQSKRGKQLFKAKGEELPETLRLLAALERLAREDKLRLGEWLLAQATDSGSRLAPAVIAWCVGRIGARVPFVGGAETAISPDIAGRWCQTLAKGELSPEVRFALVSMGRMTGDRARDLPDSLRERLTAHLEPEQARALSELVPIDRGVQQQAFGEALPEGLSLIP